MPATSKQSSSRTPMPLSRIRRVTSGIDRSTSSRTASPKRRRRTSSSMASSRSSASSSSIAMSASRVTRNRCVSVDLHAPEQLVEVGLDHLVEEDEPVPLHRDQPRQAGRDLDAGEAVLAGFRVAQADRDRERQGADVRERVAGVHGERREHREDLVVEAAPEVLVVLGDLVVVEDLDALGGQPGADRRTRSRRARRSARGRGRGSRRAAGPASGRRSCWGEAAGLDLAAQARHADLEELVEVGGEDREELDALEQRVPGVARLVEDAGVELDPRQLAVEDRRPLLAARAAPPAPTRGPGAGRTVAMSPLDCGAGHDPRRNRDVAARSRSRSGSLPRARRCSGRTSGRGRRELPSALGDVPALAGRRDPPRRASGRPSSGRRSAHRSAGSGSSGRSISPPPGPVVGTRPLGVQRAVAHPLEEHAGDEDRPRQEHEQRREDAAAGPRDRDERDPADHQDDAEAARRPRAMRHAHRLLAAAAAPLRRGR